MSGRIYLCPIIGTGASLDDAQRALVSGLAGVLNCRSLIAVAQEGPGRGRPLQPWAVCYVEASDWIAIDSNSDCYHLTAETLDAAIRPPVRAQLRQRLGMTDAQINGFANLRSLIAHLVQQHYPGVTWSQAFPEVP